MEPKKPALLSPDGPTPSFMAISRDRRVLNTIGQPAGPLLVTWVPQWGAHELKFLNAPSTKNMLSPPNAKKWEAEFTYKEALEAGNNYHSSNLQDIAASRGGQAKLLKGLKTLAAPQRGRMRVLSTIADVFATFAERYAAGSLTLRSTAYPNYQGMDDIHKDEHRLLVNFATGIGSDIVDHTHPNAVSLKSLEVSRDRLGSAVSQLPANSFSIWYGMEAGADQALSHTSPAADPAVKSRRFFQAHKPIKP